MSIFDSTTTPDPVGTTEPVVEPVAPVAPEMPSVTDAAALPDPGQPAVSGPGEAPAEPQYLDLEQYGTHLVKVKVDGEDRELPLSEVRNGLMMQQAFTQRTQQLAEERRRLAQAEALVQALEQNPAAVLKELSDVYDLDHENGFTPVERTQQELQFRAMQQQAKQLQSQMAEQRLQGEVAALKQEFGQDIDLQPAARYALDRPGMTITDAYKAIQFEQLRAQQTQSAEAARRAQAAAAASGVTHNGASGQRGVTTTPQRPAQNIREAFMAAKRAHT